jgi:hypothetical protein
MAIDYTIKNGSFDEVSFHIPDIKPGYNEVFKQFDLKAKVKELIENGPVERFCFLKEDHINRCGAIPVTFVHPDNTKKTVLIREQDSLDKELEIASDDRPEVRLLTEFFLTQDAYFWPAGQIGMELQSKGLPVNIRSVDPESITVTCDDQNTDVSYIFRQTMKDGKMWSNEDPEGVTFGQLIHEFSYRIDRELGKVTSHTNSITLKPEEDSPPFKVDIYPKHIEKPLIHKVSTTAPRRPKIDTITRMLTSSRRYM